MLFLDGMYIDGAEGVMFRWIKARTSAELTYLAYTIARGVGHFLERQGLLEREAHDNGQKDYL